MFSFFVSREVLSSSVALSFLSRSRCQGGLGIHSGVTLVEVVVEAVIVVVTVAVAGGVAVVREIDSRYLSSVTTLI